MVKAGEPVQFHVTSVDTRHTFTITDLYVDVDVTQKLTGETAVPSGGAAFDASREILLS